MTTSSADCTIGLGRTWTGTIPATPMSPIGPVDITLNARAVVIHYGTGRSAAIDRTRFREWFFRGADALRTTSGLVLNFGRRAFVLTYAERSWTAPGVVVRDLAWSLTDDERKTK